MAEIKKRYFPRNPNRVDPKVRDLNYVTFLPAQEIIIERHLRYLDDVKVMVSCAVVARLIRGMCDDLGFNSLARLYIENRVAIRLGYNSWKHMARYRGTREQCLEKIRIQQGHRETLALNDLERGKIRVNDFIGYFFYQEPQYLAAIEECLSIHTDEWLEESRRTGQKLSFEEWCLSFGEFFRKVIYLPTIRESEVGRSLLRRLARMVYCWHHREHIPAATLVRTIRHLPKKYRTTTFKDRLGNSLPDIYSFEDVPMGETYEGLEEELSASSWHNWD